MSGLPVSMRALSEEFSKMPGIGPKTAQRLAFYILKTSKHDAENLCKAVARVKETVRSCSICNNLSDSDICDICRNSSRNGSLLCVVEEPDDVIAIEKTASYNGMYHVLLGSLSPLDGIGPSELKIKELFERVEKSKFKEIIVATDFDTEGEATALYLFKALKSKAEKITRIAYGIPVGGDLVYADQATMLKAFEGRRDMK